MKRHLFGVALMALVGIGFGVAPAQAQQTPAASAPPVTAPARMPARHVRHHARHRAVTQQAAATARTRRARTPARHEALAATTPEAAPERVHAPDTMTTSMVLVDVNSASRTELMAVPGISGAMTDRIIAGRPYSNLADLVSRGVLSQEEYGPIAWRVYVKQE